MNIFQSLTGTKQVTRPQVKQYVPGNKSASKSRQVGSIAETPLQIFHRRIRGVTRDTPNSIDYRNNIRQIIESVGVLFGKSVLLRGDETNDALSMILNGLLDEIGVPNKSDEVSRYNAVIRLLDVSDPIWFKIF